jgi:hypothetical protein
MCNERRLALYLMLALCGLAASRAEVRAAPGDMTITGTVYNTDGTVLKSAVVHVIVLDSLGSTVAACDSNSSTGEFTVSKTGYPWPTDKTITVTFNRTGLPVTRTITGLLGPSTTTVIDPTVPVPQ